MRRARVIAAFLTLVAIAGPGAGAPALAQDQGSGSSPRELWEAYPLHPTPEAAATEPRAQTETAEPPAEPAAQVVPPEREDTSVVLVLLVALTVPGIALSLLWLDRRRRRAGAAAAAPEPEGAREGREASLAFAATEGAREAPAAGTAPAPVPLAPAADVVPAITPAPVPAPLTPAIAEATAQGSGGSPAEAAVGEAPRAADRPAAEATGEGARPEGDRPPAEAAPEAGVAPGPPQERAPAGAPLPPDVDRRWTADIEWREEGGVWAFRVLARADGADPRPVAASAPLEWPPTTPAAIQALSDAVEALESALVSAGWTPLEPGDAWYARRFAWEPVAGGRRPRWPAKADPERMPADRRVAARELARTLHAAGGDPEAPGPHWFTNRFVRRRADADPPDPDRAEREHTS